MAINLFSGLPGHGKTLRALWAVEKLRKESGRDVYYHRIKELTLPWLAMDDPRLWFQLPHGSIIVIDEAHEVFPKRPPGSKVPEYVDKLAVHRHSGYDIFLITQHAMNQLDHFVRGLIEQHHHSVRLFNLERARVHMWPTFCETINDWHSKKEAVTEIWKFPKELYGCYKSAEVHTVRAKVPWKPFAVIGGGGIALVGLAYLAYAQLWANVGGELEKVTGSGPGSISQSVNPLASVRAASLDASEFAPSVPAAPFSAPFYREAVKVTQAPQIVGCGMTVIEAQGDKTIDCKCHTQQGNRVELPVRVCMQYVKNGSFRFDRPDDYYPKIEPYVPPLAPPVTTDSGSGVSGGSSSTDDGA